MDELHLLCSTIKPHIVVITESWLTPNILDEQVALPCFGVPIRCDRVDGRKGGGVCIYVNNELTCSSISGTNINNHKYESVCLRIHGFAMTVLGMYVPPGLKKLEHDAIMENVNSFLESILSDAESGKLLVCGDFNDFSTELLELEFSLSQVVTLPTRENAILDKILLDVELSEQYDQPIVGPNLSSSDHRTVFLPPLRAKPALVREKRVYDYRESNIAKFVKSLASHNWSHFYRSNLDLDDKVQILHERIDNALDKIPYEFVKMTKNDKPWITPKLKLLINKRFEAFRAKKWNIYQHLKAKIKKEIRRSKQKWLEKCSSNSNGLWKCVKEVRNKRCDNNLAALLRTYPTITVAAEEINNALCENFSPKPDWSSIEKKLVELQEQDDSWSLTISVDSILKELLTLKEGKAAGSDGIPPRLLKAGADILAPILTHLISLSFEVKRFPQKWKLANIVPLPKKRNPTIKDIRPVSLLPVFGKICEKIILSTVKEHLIEMYGSDQFGFRPQSSTTISHIKLHDYITTQLEEASVDSVLLVSFDMSRAFDSLSHDALMQTLISSNLPTGFVEWCSDYLRNRKQRVKIEEELSSFVDITSGVPQGSIIAPFLFCLQMSSAKALTLNALTMKYADDILIAIPICEASNIPQIIDDEVENMTKWCCEHGLRLNPGKTKSLVICKKRNQKLSTESSQSTIHPSQADSMKILGITYNSKCNWKSHIVSITRDVSRRMYVLRQLKPFLARPLLTQVYCAIIRSRLEYCSAVYVGLSAGEMNKLENVQRRCHKIICGSHHCNCATFTPLKERRVKRAMSLFSEISNSQHLLHDLYPPLLPHGKRLTILHHKTNRRMSSFVPFCTRMFNEIVPHPGIHV